MKCNACNGRKRVMGLGMMMQDCWKCEGSGNIDDPIALTKGSYTAEETEAVVEAEVARIMAAKGQAEAKPAVAKEDKKVVKKGKK